MRFKKSKYNTIHLSEFNNIYKEIPHIKKDFFIPNEIILNILFEYMTFNEKIIFTVLCKKFRKFESLFSKEIYVACYMKIDMSPYFNYFSIKSPLNSYNIATYQNSQIKSKYLWHNEKTKWEHITCHCAFRLLEMKRCLVGNIISISKLVADSRITKFEENVMRKMEYYFLSKNQTLLEWIKRDTDCITSTLFHMIFFMHSGLPHPHIDSCSKTRKNDHFHDLNMFKKFLSFEYSSTYIDFNLI